MEYAYPSIASPLLRLRKLPVNEMANTVPVVKLEFDSLPKFVATGEHQSAAKLLRRIRGIGPAVIHTMWTRLRALGRQAT